MEKTVECQLNAFYGTSFFIAFYNDDSAVPSVTSNRYHAIVMFYTETNFPNLLQVGWGNLLWFLPYFLRCKHIFFYLFHTIFIIVYAMVVSVSAMKDTKTQTESHRSALTSFTEFLS